jgi:hypothetical protein
MSADFVVESNDYLVSVALALEPFAERVKFA